MRLKTILGVLFASLAMHHAAIAENNQLGCVIDAPSFVPTAENLIGSKEWIELRRSYRMVVVRRSTRDPACEIRLISPTTHRGDGSGITLCEFRCKSQEWKKCNQLPRDVGTGYWDGNALCWRQAEFGRGEEVCGTFHREGSRYAFKHVRGRRSCFEGDVVLEVDRR